MSQLTIEIDTPEDEALLLQLLPRLNGRVIEKRENGVQKKLSFAEALEKLKESGVAEKFGDPSAWQRDVRSWDRVLDGREE